MRLGASEMSLDEGLPRFQRYYALSKGLEPLTQLAWHRIPEDLNPHHRYDTFKSRNSYILVSIKHV
jgi:hypothetical protein